MNALPLRALMVALVLASAPAVAQEEKIDPAVLTEGFLAAHPDLRWRAEEVRSYERKDYDEALAEFRRAAFGEVLGTAGRNLEGAAERAGPGRRCRERTASAGATSGTEGPVMRRGRICAWPSSTSTTRR